MEGARRPKKSFGWLDKWSSWALMAMFAVGVVLIVVDAALMVSIWGESPKIEWLWWRSTPTPASIATIQISPSEGMPGVTVAVLGQGWKPDEFLEIQLSDPSGLCPQQSVRMTNVGPEGRFKDEFVFPPDGCWAGLQSVQLIARSEAAYIEALHAAATYRVADDRLEIVDAGGSTRLVFQLEQ